MFYYVYILESAKNKSLYVGYTNDLRRRFKQHNDGFVTYTRKYVPWTLIHYEAYYNKDDAMRREKYLKTSQGSRLFKRMLKEYFHIQKLKN
jgi:putative endonuclease